MYYVHSVSWHKNGLVTDLTGQIISFLSPDNLCLFAYYVIRVLACTRGEFLLSEDVVVALSGYLNAIFLADRPSFILHLVTSISSLTSALSATISRGDLLRGRARSSIIELTCCFLALCIATNLLQWLQSLFCATFVPSIRSSATYLTYLHTSVPKAIYPITSNSRFAAVKNQQPVSRSMPMIAGIKTMILKNDFRNEWS